MAEPELPHTVKTRPSHQENLIISRGKGQPSLSSPPSIPPLTYRLNPAANENIARPTGFVSPPRQKSCQVRAMKNIHAVLCLAFATASLVACGKSKIDQCNAFIEQANASQTAVSGLDAAADDATKLEAAATKIEEAAKKVDTVELKDEKLVGFKGNYVKNLNALAKTAKDLAGIQKDAKDPAKGAAAETKLKTVLADAEKLEKDDDKLINDINAYCSAN